MIWFRSANSHCGPAAPWLHQRPDRWQHPTTRQCSSKIACISRGVHRGVHGLARTTRRSPQVERRIAPVRTESFGRCVRQGTVCFDADRRVAECCASGRTSDKSGVFGIVNSNSTRACRPYRKDVEDLNKSLTSGQVRTVFAASIARSTSREVVRQFTTLIRIARNPRHVVPEKKASPVALIFWIVASVKSSSWPDV
jgi:hypothetical protein